MNWMKGFALVTVLALPLTALAGAGASAAESATDTKPSTSTEKPATPDTKTTKKPTKAQISAYQSKCTDEADAKGLFVKKGKGEERKKFRAECIKKLSGDAM